MLDGYEKNHAKKIIIAAGASYRELNLPGEQVYKGKGISYCATCDAKYFGDKDVIVIGGGNSSVKELLFITRFASTVTIVHQFDKLQGNKEAQERAFANKKIKFVFEHEPRAFIKNSDGGMTVTVVNLKIGKTENLSCDGVFVFAGMKPNLDMFGSQLKTDEWGYLPADETMRTKKTGVFAAGDIRSKPYRQITTAVADGTIAAITALKELEQ